MTIGLVGAAGFVGAAVEQALHDAEQQVRGVHAPRITATLNGSAIDLGPYEHLIDSLQEGFNDCDVVVNAAGLAQPDSGDRRALEGANAVMPALCFEAASRAGATRFVHISSAAVQGRRPVLDDTSEKSPFSPYSRSKALGEDLLEALRAQRSGTVLTIYRPTSVQGVDRAVTAAIASFNRLPVVPVSGKGTSPIPLAHIENVGSAAAFLALCAKPPTCCVHPWEGITNRVLMEVFAPDARKISVPSPIVRSVHRMATATASRIECLQGPLRRIELLMIGQQVEARALPDAGFDPPLGVEAYFLMADEIHRQTRPTK